MGKVEKPYQRRGRGEIAEMEAVSTLVKVHQREPAMPHRVTDRYRLRKESL
jgi:hypothetical protein